MSTPAAGGDGPQDRVGPAHLREREMPVIGADGTIGAPQPSSGRIEPRRASAPVARGATTSAFAVFGDHRREGAWTVPASATVTQLFGDVRLDLREARFENGDEVEIACYGAFGDVKLIVPPGADVEVRGFTLLGDHKLDTRPGIAPPGFPRIVVHAYGMFGDVVVRALDPGEAEPKWWQRRR